MTETFYGSRAKPVSIRFDKSGFARNRQLTDSLKDFKSLKKVNFQQHTDPKFHFY